MQHAETYSVPQESRACLAIHDEVDCSLYVADDSAFPEEVNLDSSVFYVESNVEGVTSVLDLQTRESRWQSVPVAISNGYVHPAEDFLIAQPNIAQIACFKD